MIEMVEMIAQRDRGADLAAAPTADDETVGNPQLPRSGYEARAAARGARLNKVCQQCGAAYYAPPARAARRRYCSLQCRATAEGSDYACEPPYAPQPGEPGFIGSLAEALALVEVQLASAWPNERHVLQIERDVLRALLRGQEAAAGQRLEERLQRRLARRQERQARRQRPTTPSPGNRPQASS